MYGILPRTFLCRHSVDWPGLLVLHTVMRSAVAGSGSAHPFILFATFCQIEALTSAAWSPQHSTLRFLAVGRWLRWYLN